MNLCDLHNHKYQYGTVRCDRCKIVLGAIQKDNSTHPEFFYPKKDFYLKVTYKITKITRSEGLKSEKVKEESRYLPVLKLLKEEHFTPDGVVALDNWILLYYKIDSKTEYDEYSYGKTQYHTSYEIMEAKLVENIRARFFTPDN